MNALFNYNRGNIQQAYNMLERAIELDGENSLALELMDKIEKIAHFQKIQLESQIKKIEEEKIYLESQLEQEQVEEKVKINAWDEFHFKMGENYFNESRFNMAYEEFEKSLEIFPDNVIARYYLFKIARNRDDTYDIKKQTREISKFIRPYTLWKRYREEGSQEKIPEIMELIKEYFKYFPGEEFDNRFTAEYECYLNVKLLENAYFEAKNLENMKEFFYNSFDYKIIPELNNYKAFDYDFDVAKLIQMGLLSEEKKCPAGGEYIVVDNRILCSVCDVLPAQTEEIFEGQYVRSYTPLDNNMYLKYKTVGDNFLDRHRYDNALINYTEALKYFPDSYDLNNKIGVIYKIQNNLDKAQEFFEKSIELRFDFIPAFNNLAAVFHEKKDFENAVNILNQALLIKGADFNIHYNLGLNYEKLGRNREAVRAYSNAILIDGREPDPFIRSAIVYDLMGEKDKALENMIKARPLVKDSFELSNLVENYINALRKK